jgi:hydroxypyruvate reductase
MTDAGRRLLLDLWTAGSAAVDGRAAVRRYLENVSLRGRCRIIAIGKAAAAMTLGAHDVLGDQVVDTLVVTKAGHVPDQLTASIERFDLYIASHPIPDRRSLAAGAAVLARVATTSACDELLFLISGGASSLAEVPAPGLTLTELITYNEWLLASGLPIGEVNTVRGRLSQLKAGRLAAHLEGRNAMALLISDVPGDDPAVIGSGMLVAAARAPLPASLPVEWRQRLESLPDPRPAAC